MVNRIQHLVDRQAEQPQTDEYYEIEIMCYPTLQVSFATALYIERCLDHMPRARWIEFRDLLGARHRVLSDWVYAIRESTPAVRAAERAFKRARDKEEEGDSLS
jgi:hypothetical protein